MGTDSPTSSFPSTNSGTSAGTGRVVFDRYEIGRLLGRGGSAKVYLARDLQSNSHVALKLFSKSSKAPAGTAIAVREISLMRKLRHKHVLRLIEVLASRSKIYLSLELARGGELFTRVESRGRFPEETARKYFRQLISAVRYCHSRGVFHRDLKPENILLDENGDLKIADFGLGALSGGTNPDGLFHTLCGTPAYVAPEVLAKKAYDASKVDVWSCGVILFVLTAGYLPFNHPNLMTMYRKIYRSDFRFPKWISPTLRSLISRMLDPNPATRITVEGVDGITSHPWFLSGIDAAEWTSEMRSHEDMFKFEDKSDDEKRALNAFDIISFSAGCDLSPIFDPTVSVRERFFMAEPAETVLKRVEDAVEGEGMRLRSSGEEESKGVLIEGQNGNFVASVEVCCASYGLSMVEVIKGDGSSEKLFWKEKLGPALNRPV
ncbi:CBL-interacting Serine/Threonine-kinase [Rhynchospora pubera]|uniref:non-specific serine/threonine protein kinase n=1 Tax=Rhynchospora pubera TaxID=906938 RepID=A0AAV8D8Y8_9POAL|nr:CBL-interacting Serine/Threonine-kinase [Rhynchospora pubera]